MLTYYVRRPRPLAWLDAQWLSGMSGGSRLPIDLHEDSEGFELVASIPGFKPDEVSIEVENDVLTLRGKAASDEDGQREYLVREIGMPDFERRLRLPATVDASKAEASIENGLLKVRIPKAEEARPRRIPVKAG
ncbi:MAG TPA: Hsp20/alpha crystallin family protein [Anaerolineales bacterium]|nr:Hsp20/alpha crystallin family protein [Anaerolineales bacterium]